jgi:hypothetical protein
MLDGLRDLGYTEGKQFTLDVRDAHGDLEAVEEAAAASRRARSM